MLANGGSKFIVARTFGLPKFNITRELKLVEDHDGTRHRRANAVTRRAEVNRVLMDMLQNDLENAAAHPLGQGPARDIALRHSPLVLIVDDDREVVRGLNIRLKSNGYDILSAYDGREGLDTALELRPDAIVLDIRMPGMDGLTMLSKLREHDSAISIPTVVLSGKFEEQAEMEALELGASCYLHKPCETGVLVEAVRSAMDATPGS